VTWGVFAVFAEQRERVFSLFTITTCFSPAYLCRSDVKWAALALGVISAFAVVRSMYVLAQDVRAGVGGGLVRLPPDEEHVPDSSP
jgi:hypothetical protein